MIKVGSTPFQNPRTPASLYKSTIFKNTKPRIRNEAPVLDFYRKMNNDTKAHLDANHEMLKRELPHQVSRGLQLKVVASHRLQPLTFPELELESAGQKMVQNSQPRDGAMKL